MCPCHLRDMAFLNATSSNTRLAFLRSLAEGLGNCGFRRAVQLERSSGRRVVSRTGSQCVHRRAM